MSRITRKNKLPELVFSVPKYELITEELSSILKRTVKVLKDINDYCYNHENCEKCPFFKGYYTEHTANGKEIGVNCINADFEVSELIDTLSDYVEEFDDEEE